MYADEIQVKPFYWIITFPFPELNLWWDKELIFFPPIDLSFYHQVSGLILRSKNFI